MSHHDRPPPAATHAPSNCDPFGPFVSHAPPPPPSYNGLDLFLCMSLHAYSHVNFGSSTTSPCSGVVVIGWFAGGGFVPSLGDPSGVDVRGRVPIGARALVFCRFPVSPLLLSRLYRPLSSPVSPLLLSRLSLPLGSTPVSSALFACAPASSLPPVPSGFSTVRARAGRAAPPPVLTPRRASLFPPCSFFVSSVAATGYNGSKRRASKSDSKPGTCASSSSSSTPTPLCVFRCCCSFTRPLACASAASAVAALLLTRAHRSTLLCFECTFFFREGRVGSKPWVDVPDQLRSYNDEGPISRASWGGELGVPELGFRFQPIALMKVIFGFSYRGPVLCSLL